MVVLQDGCAFDVTAEDLKIYLRAVAGGEEAVLEQFGIEVGDYLGDFTDMSPASARVLQGALAADALGRSAEGDLSLLAHLGPTQKDDGGASARSASRPVAA